MAFVKGSHVYLTDDHERKNMLRPIDTRWKNNVFRSRNEARWAIILDALDVRYVYEPVGVILPNNMGYLPDLYIDDTGYYVDAKEDGMLDGTINHPNLKEAMRYFNDPNNKGPLIKGYEQYPNSGLLITPAKMFLNTPDGPYGQYHERNKDIEQHLYNFILTLIGVDSDDPRFVEWSEDNPNFVHIKNAVYRGITAKFEHGASPIPIGYRATMTQDELFDEYGTTTIGKQSGDYLWDYMTKFQKRQLKRNTEMA